MLVVTAVEGCMGGLYPDFRVAISLGAQSGQIG
jgi:hypothetical protein